MCEIVLDRGESAPLISPILREVGHAARIRGHALKHRSRNRLQFGFLGADHVNRDSGRLGNFCHIFRPRQEIFSPRSVNFTYGLDYIAANIDAPAVALQYPSHGELIRELKKGPDYVGISFNLVLFQHMKEVVALVREHGPRAKVVLGGLRNRAG